MCMCIEVLKMVGSNDTKKELTAIRINALKANNTIAELMDSK